MVNHAPDRVQPKPFNQEALDRLLNSTKFKPFTHVEVKMSFDTTVHIGTPDDQWLQTAAIQYEKAANAAIDTVLGFDVMTTEPPTPPLLINGTFILSQRGVQNSLYFVYLLHIDDEYMPKFRDHLQQSNNFLTWNPTGNLFDGYDHVIVSLPKEEGRKGISSELPVDAGQEGMHIVHSI